MHWEAGKVCTFDKLDSMAKTICNNMCSNGSWNSIDPKDAKIIALTTEVNNVKQELLASKRGGNTSTNSFILDPWHLLMVS